MTERRSNARGRWIRTKVLTARVPLALAAKVDALAACLERPGGWIVKQAADVDAGQVIDHQALQAWTESLGKRKLRPAPRP
jgi:predicted transcriptional regulator